MAKRIYQVGEPCDDCGISTIAGKDGTGYCKPCYIKWKNSQNQMKPAVNGYNPATPTAQARVQKSVDDNVSRNINTFEARKEESIKHLTAFGHASDMVAAEIQSGIGKEFTEDEIVAKVKSLYKKFRSEILDPPFIS